MKKILLTGAALLALNFAYTGWVQNVAYAAPGDDAEVEVRVTKEYKGAVNWDKGSKSYVEAVGYGVAPVNAMGPQAEILARRAALIDAQRNLLEVVNGIQVDSETVVENLAIKSDVVRTQISGHIKGAKILSEGRAANGSYYVKMALPMFGANSLANTVYPEIAKNTLPEPLPQVTADVNTPSMKEVKRHSYTSVIVDASGLGLEATYSPVIFDAEGKAIYGVKNINKDYAISKGMVEYAADLDVALHHSERAGNEPLVVKAVAVKGGRNSVNRVNAVVSVEDGQKILLANQKTGLLQQCRVIFVK